ncbi:uncharacterized protein A4U43_C05F14150 [Asparagus officinalis]|uniref:Uncharacterized protein n=1 Tax=Asparagus officinalis TaxID=4686 RepID=A0A5P1EVW2_ASPOF|nr:uncharacterized protein A4U43_C05F14150 [Asparagus officinalis]
MMQLRFTSLLVGLLLALWVARGATSKVLAGNDQALGSVNELDDRSKTIVSIQSRKLKVGKVGELDVAQKEAKNGMNTGANLSSVRKCERGKDINSPNKSYGTQYKKGSSTLEPTINVSNSPGKFQASQEPYQTMGTQKLLKATADIFRMMNKDYHQRPHRRPPINN